MCPKAHEGHEIEPNPGCQVAEQDEQSSEASIMGMRGKAPMQNHVGTKHLRKCLRWRKVSPTHKRGKIKRDGAQTTVRVFQLQKRDKHEKFRVGTANLQDSWWYCWVPRIDVVMASPCPLFSGAHTACLDKYHVCRTSHAMDSSHGGGGCATKRPATSTPTEVTLRNDGRYFLVAISELC